MDNHQYLQNNLLGDEGNYLILSTIPSLSISDAAKTGEIGILSVEPSKNKNIITYLTFNL